jgi:leucine dehydrogenase
MVMMQIYKYPCAMGATINDVTVHKIKAKVIAGGANNQLQTKMFMVDFARARYFICPDFLINAGELNVYAELAHYGKEEIMSKTENITTT